MRMGLGGEWDLVANEPWSLEVKLEDKLRLRVQGNFVLRPRATKC